MNQNSPLAKALSSAKEIILPGIFLWAIALSLVIAYYQIPSLTALLSKVATLKNAHNYSFAIIGTMLCGGIIPFVFLYLRKPSRYLAPLSHIPFVLIFWAYKGIEINFVYDLQAKMFGYNSDLGTVIIKVLMDQFFYNPFIIVPYTLCIFAWKESGFNIEKTKKILTRSYIVNQYWALLFSTWMVWMPTVCMLYSLPTLLQVPFFNIILCFWVLLLSVLSSGKKKK